MLEIVFLPLDFLETSREHATVVFNSRLVRGDLALEPLLRGRRFALQSLAFRRELARQAFSLIANFA